MNNYIDAYPYYIAYNKEKPEAFINALEALSSTYSAIELYNISPEHLKIYESQIQHKGWLLTLITTKERMYIREKLISSGLSKQVKEEFICSSILRACLDARFRGILTSELIDSVIEFVKSIQKN